jgi:CelD/BcsL family acetyltransferase involved in cellulose biosynthesis
VRNVTVSFGSPDQDIAEHWMALSGRAAVNVFMNPAALMAAHTTGIAEVFMLLAWTQDAQPKRLVGIWAVRKARLAPIWPSFVAAPPYSYAWVSNPVIDPEFMDEVVTAFLDTIERDARLPKVLRLRYLDADCESYDSIVRVLAARGSPMLKLLERERAFVTPEFGRKLTGSTRKKLRQDWQRLCALGKVEVVNGRSGRAAQEGFETYLAMEAAGWKGAGGTALLSNDADAAFARRLVAALGAEGNASVALLTVDGRAVAAQVLFYCGSMAYTWRTAFDVAFGKFSPGALLVDHVTEQLFAAGGIDAIESCSPQGGFMKQMWEGRRATVDLLADLGTRKSLGFAALAIGERSHALRSAYGALRAGLWRVKQRWRTLRGLGR